MKTVRMKTAVAVSSAVKVPRLWPGATIVCLGNGSSLTSEDVDYCRGKARVIAINDTVRLAPWADVLYSSDLFWFRKHRGVPSFTGLKYTLDCVDVRPEWRINRLRGTKDSGLELDPSELRLGRNSGHAAVNLAVHLGASRILLLGFDMQGGRWFETARNQKTTKFNTFRGHFSSLIKPLGELGISLINCSRNTALTCVPRQKLEDALR